MSFFTKLLGGGLMQGVTKVAGIISDHKERKINKDVALANLEQELPRLQAEINKLEANHPSLFVSGWRPAAGWVCVFGLGYSFVVRPIANGLVAIVLATASKPALADGLMPAIAVGELLSLLTAMLGLAAYRMSEKKSGKARD